VNRRDDRGERDSRQPAPETGEAEAARTAIVIAGLRARLKRPGILTSPAVLLELRKLV
jgi:hypothetical protein